MYICIVFQLLTLIFTKMKKIIIDLSSVIFISLFLFFYSCSNDEFSDLAVSDPGATEPANVRAIFQSSNDMIDEYILLSRYSQDDLKGWIRSKGIESALDVENISDNSLLNRPQYLRAILNKDLEFQIQDTVVWYHQGNLYVLSVNKEDDYQMLKERKKNPDELVILGRSEIDPVQVEAETSQNDIELRTFVRDGYTTGLRTYQFQCGLKPGATFRYHHELYAHRFSAGGNYISELNYVANVQYLNGSVWVSANYPRNIDFRFYNTVSYPSKGRTFSFNDYRVSPRNIVGVYTVNLATVNPASSSASDGWEVTLSAGVHVTMVNYPATSWWYDHYF